MFGTKLRTWMETHIVRSRKKQHRNKEDKKSGNCSKTSGSSPCHIESNSFERQYGKTCPRHHEDKRVLEVQAPAVGLPSTTSMSLQKNNNLRCAVNNLSSPESAYSTGYSTDGTSPGASVPPEYYINIRTGTHYFHSNPPVPPSSGVHPSTNPCKALVSDSATKVGSLNQLPVSNKVLSPRPGRHKRDDGNKKKSRQTGESFPESSTEEDIIDRLSKAPLPQQVLTPKAKSKLMHPMFNNVHRRTESYNESQQRALINSYERDSGDSLTNGYHCTSPYLPGASPRQRNRIRTNPWLNSGQCPNGLPGCKTYNSQGETSSTVDSSSTLSSSGCKHTSDEAICLSPRSRERRRLMKDHLRDLKNSNSVQNSSFVFSPILNGKKHTNAVTTCSPQPNRSCNHSVRERTPSSSSSGSSSPSPASDDEHHGNTSDFSDDDVTLNEMLGKFDESYVYEKETDILSDSDPTDCEDHGAEEDQSENSNYPESVRNEDFDFIDNGSLVELAHSDSEHCNKKKLAGHCTYHHMSGHTPESSRKLTPRLRESLMRRQSRSRTSRERQSRRSSRNRSGDGRNLMDSPVLSAHERSRTYKKSSSQSLDVKNSNETISMTSSPINHPKRRSKQVDPVFRPSDTPGKCINLNRVLMERLINNQRNGTRSADGTPVSLRKRGPPSMYNGKYIKNHYVTNLITSDANFNEHRSSLDDKLVHVKLDGKPRSNSLSVHSNEVPDPSPVNSGLNELDKEGDIKYRQLIQEAENIIEDLQVKSRSDYLSPIFRCKNGMERAKPSSPLVFSVPQSPLSLRYDVYRDDIEPPFREITPDSNSLYEHEKRVAIKEKTNGNEDGLLKTISKTLERIMIRGASDTNRKLDKSVSDPFAKGKRTFVLPSTEIIYSNIASRDDKKLGPYGGFATPNLLRRSSTGNTTTKLTAFNSPSKLNQNEIPTQSNFRKFFRRSDKNKTASFGEHLDRHDFPENGICFDTGFNNHMQENTYENIANQHTTKSRCELNSNAKFQETRVPLTDYSPNGNTPIFMNGFPQIPWQHRNSQAERLKSLSILQQSPNRKTDSPELVFDKKPSLSSFRSFDLGNRNTAGTGYCPQSEPVKRKIYTCSATFEKLQKTLLGKEPEMQPSIDTTIKSEPEAGGLSDLRPSHYIREVIEENVQEESKPVNRVNLTMDRVDTD